MSEAYAAARGGAEGVLCVSTLLTFASNWLAQHLGSFQIDHPSHRRSRSIRRTV